MKSVFDKSKDDGMLLSKAPLIFKQLSIDSNAYLKKSQR